VKRSAFIDSIYSVEGS